MNRRSPPSVVERPIPRAHVAWALAIFVLAALTLAYPALAGQFLINPRSDQYLAGFAFRDFAAQSLKSGHGFPQWNPFLQGGVPYIAGMAGDIFYPTFLLRAVLPTDVAMTWEFVIHLFLCGLFTYLFLRAWGIGFHGSLIGGLAYMLGGSIAGLASPGHDGKLFVSTLTPAGLLLLTRAVRDGRAWAWGLFAVVVGLTFLSPHPQLFEYFLILSGFFTLFAAFGNHERGSLDRTVAIRRVAIALGCVLIGCLIGAIQYWPSLIEYKPWSPRAAGHDWAQATSFSYPIEEILNWYWPRFSGLLDSYWGRNPVHLHSDYFGAVVLMLAGAAFGKSARTSFRRFWLITAIISLVWAFGGFTPFYHVVMAVVPMTRYLRAPSTMIYITALSVAVLAALGTERLLAREVGPKYAIKWGIGAAVFAMLMSIGGYAVLANGVANSVASAYPPEAHGQVVDEIVQRAQANAGSAIVDVWRSFFFVAFAAAVMWGYLTDRLKSHVALAAIAVVLALDLWSIERVYWIFSPPASKLFASDAAIDAIKADIAKTGRPGRTLTLPVGQGIVTELGRLDRTFTGNHLMVHGLRMVKGYHGNELGMYQQLVDEDSGRIVFSPQFWRHENVQYLYTGADDSLATQIAGQLRLPKFTKLAGPARNAVGSMVFAYKLPMSNPFAWVAAAIVKAPQSQALPAVLDPSYNPATVAIADTSATSIQAAQLQKLPTAASVNPTVTSYAAGAIDLTLDQPSTAGQALVVSENYFPGWHATADGKPAAVGLMNYNLIGVVLPEGTKSVQLRFEDAAYEKGKRITVVAVLVAIALWATGMLVDRRREAADVAHAV